MFHEMARTTVVMGNHEQHKGYIAFYDDRDWPNLNRVFAVGQSPNMAMQNLINGTNTLETDNPSAYDYFIFRS